MVEATPKIVYKISGSAEWAQARAAGIYHGSPDDLRDGYIHLSTAAQIAGTLARHFSDGDGQGRAGLVLLAFTVEGLGPLLKWEPARNGALFPHLYGPLDPASAISSHELPVGSSGRHILPEGLV